MEPDQLLWSHRLYVTAVRRGRENRRTTGRVVSLCEAEVFPARDPLGTAEQRSMWDERYSEAGFIYGEEPNAFLASVAGRIPPGPVLCLGEGEGRNAVFLAGLGHQVVAVDQSSVGLAKARRLAESRGVVIETIQADLASFVIETAAWAGIVSIFCHLPSKIRVPLHRSVVAGLCPGGVFVLEAYTPAQIGRGTGGPENADMMPTLAGLQAELHGLNFDHASELERDIVEGRYHTGVASVVQVVGRRSNTKVHGSRS